MLELVQDQHLFTVAFSGGWEVILDVSRGKVHYDESRSAEKYRSMLPHNVPVDLGDRLADGGIEQLFWIAHAENKDYVVEEPGNVCEGQSQSDGLWNNDGRVLSLLCDVGGSIVV